jgi:hypothetical protein
VLIIPKIAARTGPGDGAQCGYDAGVELIPCEVSTAEEVAAAFENIPEDADAIFFLPDRLLNERIGDWLEIAIELKLPTSGPNPMAVADGHLTAYGIDLVASARQEAARLADQILQGIKPADLPVETAEFYTAINLNTAKTIDLDISDEILLRQTLSSLKTCPKMIVMLSAALSLAAKAVFKKVFFRWRAQSANEKTPPQTAPLGAIRRGKRFSDRF